MRTLTPRAFSALNILNRFSAYLLARVLGNPALTAVAATAQAAHDSLYSALQAFWSAQKATMAAASFLDGLKYQLDAALRTLRTAVLVVSLNDRKSKLYRAILPDGIYRLIRDNPAGEVVRVRTILQKLAEFQNPALAAATDGLQAAVDQVSAQLAVFDDAVRAEEAAAGALETAKEAYCLKYAEIYHQIVLTLGEPRQAESYFRKIRRHDAAEVVPAAEHEVEVPAAAA